MIAATTSVASFVLVLLLIVSLANYQIPCILARILTLSIDGWDGSDKVFLFEFTMPMDGEDNRFEGDMPSIWILNAGIPRTTQYGPPNCNCWTSGCGEFDIVEALHDGSTMLKSTLHTNTPAGDSDYFSRPTGASMKLAVIFSSSSSTITIQKLDDSFEFATNMTGLDIEMMCSVSSGVSHFSVTK